MTSDLIPIEPSLSPKLLWLKKHHLETACKGTTWVCRTYGYTREASAETEDDAILEYCAKHNIRHWTLE